MRDKVLLGILIMSVSASCVRAEIGYTLDIFTNGNGSVYRDLELTSYAPNTTVLLTAVPASGFGFIGWSGSVSNSNNPLSLNVDTNKVIVANFVSYPLTVMTNGDGTIYRDVDLPGYAPNTTVILTAVPRHGYGFTGWSGDVTNETNPLILTLDEPKSITANFVSFPLTVGTNGAGKVYRDLDLDTYAPNTIVTLTAIAERHHGFAGWSGDITNNSNPLVLSMKGPKSVTANFATYTLSVSTNGKGLIVRDSEQPSYAPNSIVYITAVSGSGYHFVQWTGDAIGNSNPLRLQMKTNIFITAHFDNRPRIQIWHNSWPPGTNTYRLTLFGRAGERYGLEATSDLVQWNRIADLQNTVGWVQFIHIVPATPGFEQFYRATVLSAE